MKKYPSTITISGGHRLKPIVLKTLTFKDDGTPDTFKVYADDAESIPIEGGEDFWVVYALPTIAVPRRN